MGTSSRRGAGTRKGHYTQDAGEKYLPLQLQQIAIDRGVSKIDTTQELQRAFEREFGEPPNFFDSYGA